MALLTLSGRPSPAQHIKQRPIPPPPGSSSRLSSAQGLAEPRLARLAIDHLLLPLADRHPLKVPESEDMAKLQMKG